MKKTSTSNFIFEPINSNRYIVEFKEPFLISSYAVKSISKIKFTNNSFDDLYIELYHIKDVCNQILSGINTYNRVNKLIEFDLNFLIPTGDVVSSIHVIALIDEIDFGNFNYTENDINIIKLKLKNVKIK